MLRPVFSAVSSQFPRAKFELILKGQYHGRYYDFWPKLTKFKL